jgi:crotonobetainyl-CoA:carnitine CoA-transferase CaiB-like acyl-CoA transferase
MTLMNSPLSGFRVLDLTSVLFGPYATQLLGDLGADVIKIEQPGGDVTRSIGPYRSKKMGAAYLGCNRNKRSLVLDLKREAAKEVLFSLIDTADIFVHNIRPQKLESLGFGSAAVMGRNPGIVYAALHGYLEEGPYGGRPAYDDVIQGQCGIAGAFFARDGEPALAPLVVADKSAALMATVGINAAVIQRLRTGKGVYLEVGMFESMAAYTLLEHQFGTIFSPAIGKAGYSRAISPERKPYRTKDGYICMLAYTDKQWDVFWRLADRPDMLEDSRFKDLASRTQNIDDLYAAVGAVLSLRTSSEWLEKLTGLEVPCGPINTLDDLRSDEHLSAIGFFRPFEHPSEGSLELMDNGLRIDGECLPIIHHPPEVGEQSVEILEEAGIAPRLIEEALRQN